MDLKRINTADIVRIALFVALIAVGAFIQIPLFIVPVTLQYTMVNLSALTLKKGHGTIAVIIYILLGLIGLPVFASGSGPGYIFRFGFGYLLGFIGLTMVVSFVYNKLEAKTKWAGLIATIAGWITLYAIALPYCYFLANFVMMAPKTVTELLQAFFVVFIPGDIFSMCVSVIVVKQLSVFLRRKAVVAPGRGE